MLDLIDVENEVQTEESQTRDLRKENEILKKLLESSKKECIVCYEYLI